MRISAAKQPTQAMNTCFFFAVVDFNLLGKPVDSTHEKPHDRQDLKI
jgi:hypothetical protein